MPSIAKFEYVGPTWFAFTRWLSKSDLQARADRDAHERALAAIHADHQAALRAIVDVTIEQIDTPEAVWNRPATAFVCDFLGGANRIACMAHSGRIDVGGVVLRNSAPAIGDGAATGFIRPHEFTIGAAGSPGVAVTLRRIQRTGAASALETIAADGSIIEASIADPPAGLAPGTALALVPTAVRAYPAA